MTSNLFTLFCLLLILAAPYSSAAERPNIVVIIADDHHWQDYGFMGHKQVQTPHLDKLASQSLLFTNGHVPSSLCRPSLATILTGLYPHQHRITSNDPPLQNDPNRSKAENQAEFQRLREETIKPMDSAATLPRLLAKEGYVSFQTGKWWEGNFKRGGFTAGMTDGGRHGDKGLEIGRKTMEPMFAFMRDAQENQQPFFVWYAPFLPHTPHNAPERLLAKYRDIAPNLQTAKYWANIEWLDETCGGLLDFLEERKLDENTLVVYVCDNGWIQDPDSEKYAPKSKQSPYEGGVRTPIMFRWPGKIEAARSDALASSIDLAPTILKAVGLKPTAEMPGVDLLDIPARDGRQIIFGECFEHNAVDISHPGSSLKWRWCVEGNWKLIVPNTARVPGDVVELYDLAADPGETKNLATEKPAEVKRLQGELDRWWVPQVQTIQTAAQFEAAIAKDKCILFVDCDWNAEVALSHRTFHEFAKTFPADSDVQIITVKLSSEDNEGELWARLAKLWQENSINPGGLKNHNGAGKIVWFEDGKVVKAVGPDPVTPVELRELTKSVFTAE